MEWDMELYNYLPDIKVLKPWISVVRTILAKIYVKHGEYTCIVIDLSILRPCIWWIEILICPTRSCLVLRLQISNGRRTNEGGYCISWYVRRVQSKKEHRSESGEIHWYSYWVSVRDMDIVQVHWIVRVFFWGEGNVL